MKMIRTIVVIFATTLLSSTAAYAQDMHSACKDDVQTFCSGVQPGGGRIIDCLFDHYKDISDNCYTVLQKVEARRSAKQQGNGNPPPPPQNGQNGDGQPPVPPPGNMGGPPDSGHN